MAKRKCDNCKNEIEKENEHILKIPEEFCTACNSESYTEYYFCSMECVMEYIVYKNG